MAKGTPGKGRPILVLTLTPQGVTTGSNGM
jgi:hypothetical protein